MSQALVEAAWGATPFTFASELEGPSFTMAPHLRLVSWFLYLAAYGFIDRLGISMPPGHAKSTMCSKIFPSWCLDHWPKNEIALASYEASMAERWGRETRDFIAQHQARLGCRLSDATTAVAWWYTTQGGYMRCAGAQGALTGLRARRFVIDDPLKGFADAHSATAKDGIWEWQRSVVRSRLLPRSCEVVVMTRWAEDDLMGRLKASAAGSRWVHVTLPAVAEADETIDDVIGHDTAAKLRGNGIRLPEWWHREEGQSLWPSRLDPESGEVEAWFDEAEMADTRLEVGEWVWAALYQQRPAPLEGGMFKKSSWPWVDAMPPRDKLDMVRSWDLAATEDGGDYTVGVLMGRHVRTGAVYIIDVVRDRVGPSGVEKLLLSTAEEDRRRYGPLLLTRIEQEGGSSGKIVAQTWVSDLLSAFLVKTEKSSGDKTTRAILYAAQQGVGNVFLVRASDPERGLVEPEWADVFIHEHTHFGTGGDHDDQVDAASLGYNELAERALARRKRRAGVSSVAGTQVLAGGSGRPI